MRAKQSPELSSGEVRDKWERNQPERRPTVPSAMCAPALRSFVTLSPAIASEHVHDTRRSLPDNGRERRNEEAGDQPERRDDPDKAAVDLHIEH